jgi:adiponectin receptor
MIYICLVDFPNSELFQRGTFVDNLVIYLFLIASVKCLISSSVWHTFNGTSSLYLRKKFICVDYTGITILITASIVTTEYASLFFYPVLRTCFILFSLACGVGGLFFNWTAFFDKPESKPFRIAFYISLSAMGISAFFFLGYHKGFTHALCYYLPITRSLIWYLIGVVFYGSLVPERFRTDVLIDQDQPEENDLITEKVVGNLQSYFKETLPVTEVADSFESLWWIDYIFSSHNIWHLCVLFGILGHYSAIYEMFTEIPSNL